MLCLVSWHAASKGALALCSGMSVLVPSRAWGAGYQTTPSRFPLRSSLFTLLDHSRLPYVTRHVPASKNSPGDLDSGCVLPLWLPGDRQVHIVVIGAPE